MVTLTGNIQNRVEKLPKPSNYAQALQPLFEAISNARYAIYDRLEENAVKNGRIDVVVSDIRNPKKISASVKDNGIGLDETRFKAFCVVDTDYKKSKGGKGVGRLFWLDAFDKINVASRFGDDVNDVLQFDFLLKENNQINMSEVPHVNFKHRGTEVVFNTLRDNDYKARFPKKSETFLRYFSSHFISDFLMGVSPQIFVDIDGEVTQYPSAVQKLVVTSFSEISWESKAFGSISASGFLCDPEASAGLEGTHQVHLLGDRRTVESRKIDGLVGIGGIDFEGRDDCCLHICVDAPFLNARVNEGRTAFNIPESQLKEFTREIAEKAKSEFIGFQIAKYEISRSENYKDFVSSYPLFDFDEPEAQLQRIPFGANSPEDFAAGLVKHQIRREEDRKSAIQKIVLEISQDDPSDGAKFANKIVEIAESIQNSERLSLAQHVVRRKMVLELLDLLLQRWRQVGDNDDYYLEKTVHSVLCPTGVSSSDPAQLVSRSHDLWVIDERLAFSRAFSSDKRLDQVLSDNDAALRPDVLVWDLAYGLAYDESAPGGGADVQSTINEMMIVEFKKPMRKNYKKFEDNVEQQILKYIRQLKKGEIEAFGRDRIRISENCIFHCFVVADLVGDLEDQVEGWAKTADNNGLVRILEGNYKGSIAIIQWKDLVNDAWRRNHATLQAAGLSRTSKLIDDFQQRLRSSAGIAAE